MVHRISNLSPFSTLADMMEIDMLDLIRRLLIGAYIRISKQGNKLEITAKGPLAVIGIILIAVIFLIVGDNIVALVREW